MKLLKKNFSYVTSLEITNKNKEDIVLLGRRRWKIENQGFYNQKNRLFNITHLCSINDTALKNHYFFIQFAHTIRQLIRSRKYRCKKIKH